MRYNSINDHLKRLFGQKVYKISLPLSETCPNRDGRIGTGGCAFCSPESSIAYIHHSGDIKKDIVNGIAYVQERHKAKKFIAYFQRYTNTYGHAAELEKAYLDSIDHEDVVGLAISTRPDSIDDDVLEVLSRMNERTFLWVELGLQTANDDILKSLNRGHTVQDFIDTTHRLHERKISVAAHVILGLPNETENDILRTVTLLNELKVEGVKLHNAHILKDTEFARLYEEGNLNAMTIEEYAEKVVLFLENLDPSVLVHRFNAHAPRRLTVAPAWSVNKLATYNAVVNLLEEKNVRQGSKLSALPSERS